MEDEQKTRERLIEELNELRRQVSRADEPSPGTSLFDSREIFDSIPLPATLIDIRGIIVDINQASLDLIHRYDPEIHKRDRVGSHIAGFVMIANERARYRAFIDELLSSGEPRFLNWVSVDTAGRRLYWNIHAATLKDARGRVKGALILREDVTEKVQQEHRKGVFSRIRDEIWRMKSSVDMRQVLKAVWEGLHELGVPFMYCSVNLVEQSADPDSVMAYSMNPEGQWYHRPVTAPGTAMLLQIWRAQELVYRPDLEQEDPYDERSHLSVSLRAVVDVPFSQGTLAVSSLQPRTFSETDLEILRETAQVLSEGFSRMEDLLSLEQRARELETEIAERRQAEEALHRTQNLESLGVLAGGIAHDFNNVLTGITGNISLLLLYLNRESEEYEIAAEAKQAADRTRDLTKQLLTFARGGMPVKETTSIAELIRETTELSLRGSNTKPAYLFSDDLLSVDVDTGQMSQVIQNLIINADQSIPQGGILKIAAENVEITGRDPLPLAAGTYVKISVEDQGVGIPESVLNKVFDPYFSTKQSGHGLGLAISHSIVARHDGYITASSAVDVGTTFDLFLPASMRQPLAEPRPEERKMAAGTGRILLMDDEEVIHQTVGRILTQLGYESISVRDGREALRAYKLALEEGDPFDLVIMDLTIPGGMGGVEAVAELHKIDPQARVIVASGYSHDPVMANYEEHGFCGVVEKPVDLQTLVDTVQRILDDR